jgi:haloalkane dehalogenase
VFVPGNRPHDEPRRDADDETGRPDWLTDDVFPFASRFLDLPQGRVHYADDGNGPALLLLHPPPATSFFFKPLMLALRGRFRLIAPDFPGFGLSETAASFHGTLAAYSRFVGDFTAALGLDDVTLMLTGESGPVGLHAAARDPDRYRALVLADTFGFPLTGRGRLAQFMVRFVVPSWPSRWLNRRLNLFPWIVSTLGAYRNPLPRADRAAYRRLFATHQQRDRIVEWLRQLGTGRDFLEEVESGVRERLADKDVLLVFGQFDPARLLGFRGRFARLFPRAQLAVIAREEHFPALGSAKLVADAILGWREAVPEEVEPCPPSVALRAVP